MNVAFVSLFPEFFDAPMGVSIVGRAVEQGALRWVSVNPRDFAIGRHRSVDDTPYGGGAGMLMRPNVMADAVAHARTECPGAPVVLMSPQGARFNQSHAEKLAAGPGMILVCGRYEGVDERFVERCVDFEVSIGDFVLSGGEPAAFMITDAVTRLLPGALGNAESAVEESFSSGVLEHPQFTRPRDFEGLPVPDALCSGDHARVARWRRHASLLRTAARRPDLLTPADLAEIEALSDASRATVPSWQIQARHLHSAVDDPS